MAEFINLHNHFHTSLLDGFGTFDEGIKASKVNGQTALGITDHGNGFGIYDFIEASRGAGITPVPGLEAYIAPINSEGARRKSPVFYGKNGIKSSSFDVSANGAYLHQTLWAINNEGMYNLFKLISLSNKPEHFYQAPRIDFEMLAEHSEGLVVATGCPSSEISTRFLLGQDKEAYEYAGRLKEVFGDRLYVEIMDHNMSIDLERNLLPKQLELAKKLDIQLLATNDSHYANKEDARHHEEMLCTQSGARMKDKTYDQGGPRFAFEGQEYYLKTADEMERIFPERDYPGALSNTLKIAEMAQDINLKFDPDLKIKAIVPEGHSEATYLKHLINIGLKDRYGNADRETKQEALRRVKEEFEVLYSSDFIGYMLTVQEYLQWTKDNFSTINNGEVIASPLGVGRGCFEPGMKVTLENNTVKEIQNIKPGTKVLTHDRTYQTVTKVFEYTVENEEMVEITLTTGKTIKLTADHMIFHKEHGFTEAQFIKTGDILLGEARKLFNSRILSNEINFEENYGHYVKPKKDDNYRQGWFESFKSKDHDSYNIYHATLAEMQLLNILETDSEVENFNRVSQEDHFAKTDAFDHISNPCFEVKYRNGQVKHILLNNNAGLKVYETAAVLNKQNEYITEIWKPDEIEVKFLKDHRDLVVTKVRKYSYTGKVYDLEVANVHNYMVSGVTVHNSVGGSVIAFLLGISEVDPIRHDLLFSRFLSAGRGATYEITYEDGTTEEVVVSNKKTVLDANGKTTEKYIHQLVEGDVIV